MSKAMQKTSYRFILVGKTGSGKSATGNFLLGKNIFCSKESVNSITQDVSLCQSTVFNGANIIVVDTPGLFDTKKPVIQTALTIQDSLKFLSPGPHAFLIVLKPGRFTEEEERTLEILMIMFGPKFIDHAIIIYTHLDQMEDFDTFLNESKENPRIKSLFDSCGQRIFTLNNKEKNKDIIEREREKLMRMAYGISDNSRLFYADNISIYRVCLEKHVDEWTDTRWDVGKFKRYCGNRKRKLRRLERERQEQFQKREKEKKEEAERLEKDRKDELARIEESARKREEKYKRQIENLNKKLEEEELSKQKNELARIEEASREREEKYKRQIEHLHKKLKEEELSKWKNELARRERRYQDPFETIGAVASTIATIGHAATSLLSRFNIDDSDDSDDSDNIDDIDDSDDSD